MADYSKQLDEIAKALNRPGTSAWLISLFSAVLGLMAGLLGQRLQMFLGERSARNKMRKVLYLDLTEMFGAVHNIMSVKDDDDPYRPEWQKDQLRKALVFRGEKYCLDRQEVYVQLAERGAAEMLYLKFHRILDEENAMAVNTGLALRMYANMVHYGQLDKDYITRLYRKGAKSFLALIEDYYRQDHEGRKRMGLGEWPRGS